LERGAYRDAEDAGEHEKNEDVEEVDGSDGDVEGIGGFVHVRFHYADGNQQGEFEDEEGDCLSSSAPLGQGDKGSTQQRVDENNDEKRSHGGLVLDIEESPLVQNRGV
jgi:hypothetical protein